MILWECLIVLLVGPNTITQDEGKYGRSSSQSRDKRRRGTHSQADDQFSEGRRATSIRSDLVDHRPLCARNTEEEEEEENFKAVQR